MTLKRPSVAAAAAAAAMAIGLAACGGSDGGSGGSSGDPTTLTLAAPDDAVTVDPVFSAAPRGTEVIMNSYDPMMTYELKDGPDGVKVPDLTKPTGLSLESLTPNDDFSEWTLKLRDGLRFPDGKRVTIDDLRYTFQRNLEFKGAPGQFMYTVIAQIPDLKAVEVVDDRTVRLKLDGPNQMLPRVLALTNGGVTQQALVKQNATKSDPFAGDWMTRNTAGAGAYRLARWDPGQTIVLEANPDYAGDPKPTIKRVTYRIIPSAASRIALLRRGDVDIVQGLSSQDIESLKSTDGVKVVSVPNSYQLSLVMNNKTKPFDDKRVRQAIAYAIPYQQIIDDVYNGDAQATKGAVPVGFPGNLSDGYPYGKQDLDRARDLLSQAGHPDGFSVTMQVDSGQPDQERAAVLVQAALEEIGVKVNIQKLTAAVFNERRSKFALDFYLNLSGWDVSDPGYALTMGYTCESFLNWSQMCNKQIDADIQAAIAESDPERRAAMFDDLQRQLWDEMPMAWITQPNFTLAMREDITGFTDLGDLRIRFKYLRKG